jgi:glycosyltransferase EpsD
VFHPRAGDPTRYRPEGARFVIGCAGRLTRAKQPEDFVRLAALLERRHPDAVFLLGGDGARRDEIAKLVRRLGISNLKVMGFISDMPSFFAACDVVVLPSRAEGCPNFVLEAMAMGKPIVAARVDPVLELVEPGGAASLYPYGDVDAMAHALSVLLDDSGERAALAARAYRQSLEFTASANAGRLAALSRDLVARQAHSAEPALAPTDAFPSTVRTDHRS